MTKKYNILNINKKADFLFGKDLETLCLYGLIPVA